MVVVALEIVVVVSNDVLVSKNSFDIWVPTHLITFYVEAEHIMHAEQKIGAEQISVAKQKIGVEQKSVPEWKPSAEQKLVAEQDLVAK